MRSVRKDMKKKDKRQVRADSLEHLKSQEIERIAPGETREE